MRRQIQTSKPALGLINAGHGMRMEQADQVVSMIGPGFVPGRFKVGVRPFERERCSAGRSTRLPLACNMNVPNSEVILDAPRRGTGRS